jgi:hypothetical protein
MHKLVTAAVVVIASLLAGRTHAQDRLRTYRTPIGIDIEAAGDLKGFTLDLRAETIADGLEVVKLRLHAPTPQPPPRFTLKWSLPSHDVVGQWATGRQLNKTIRPDWSGGRLQASMFAREAPVSCLFGSAIERFVADEKTGLEAAGGRDFASVNEATDRMMTDVLAELRKLKADVMIEIPKDHFAMVQFYTGYWRKNRPVLLDGEFEALAPAANYPVLIGRAGGKQIVGLFGDVFVRLDGRAPEEIDVVNGKNSATVVLSAARDLGAYRYTIRDCQGKVVGSGQASLGKGARDFQVPVSGLLTLERAR